MANDEQDVRIVRVSMREMARALGVAPSTVMRRINRGADPEKAASPLAGAAMPPADRSKPVSDDDAAAIRKGAEEGAKTIEIAHEMGVSRSTAYRRAEKLGIDLRRGHVDRVDTVRRAVDDMTHREAVEFLLELVEQLIGQDQGVARFVGGVRLTPCQSVIFAVLERNIGRMVPRETLLTAIQAGQPDARSGPKVIDVHMVKIRRLLRGQYRIETVWGTGFRMHRDEGPQKKA